jgi:hypothetical protein
VTSRLVRYRAQAVTVVHLCLISRSYRDYGKQIVITVRHHGQIRVLTSTLSRLQLSTIALFPRMFNMLTSQELINGLEKGVPGFYSAHT